MPSIRTKKMVEAEFASGTHYRGKQTRTGNSSGFRFEGALFKSHPEFNGPVRAKVIAPGRMLVTAETEISNSGDPVMAAFLAFLGQDIATAPQGIHPLDKKLAARIDRLTRDVTASADEDLGDTPIL